MAVASWTAASDSDREGWGGSAIVSLRITGGRNPPTLTGAASDPANVTEPLTSRIGARLFQQKPSTGIAVTVRLTVTTSATICAPARGMTICVWSLGNSTRLMV